MELVLPFLTRLLSFPFPPPSCPHFHSLTPSPFKRQLSISRTVQRETRPNLR
eukprot:CCRYP_010915-RA/>CCRYP_010915-RA protein AED:0.00 eAED:0.00 QI:114/1/1/1/0/0/2/72/51